MKKIMLIFSYFIFIASGFVFADNGDTIVYITKTGSKYHRATCSSLKSSMIPIALKEVTEQRYKPCKKCNPLEFIIETQVPENITTGKEYNNLESIVIPACENPENIIHHTGYSLLYSEKDEQAFWVAYVLTRDEVYGNFTRKDSFRADSYIATGSSQLLDYKGSGYDRGHLIPAADLKWSIEAMKDSFYLSNVSPQKPGFNRGIWRKLEQWVREKASKNNVVCVVTGPVLKNGPYETIGSNEVSIPKEYYKVILDYTEPEVKAIGFILPNKASNKPLSSYAVSVDTVENMTGIDFFPMIDDKLESQLESEFTFTAW